MNGLTPAVFPTVAEQVGGDTVQQLAVSQNTQIRRNFRSDLHTLGIPFVCQLLHERTQEKRLGMDGIFAHIHFGKSK